MIVSRLCFTKRRKELSVQKKIPSEGPAERAEKDYFYSKNLPICDPEDDTEMKERGKAIGELKQPRRARQQECHKFAYLTKKKAAVSHALHVVFLFLYISQEIIVVHVWHALQYTCVPHIAKQQREVP